MRDPVRFGLSAGFASVVACILTTVAGWFARSPCDLTVLCVLHEIRSFQAATMSTRSRSSCQRSALLQRTTRRSSRTRRRAITSRAWASSRNSHGPPFSLAPPRARSTSLIRFSSSIRRSGYRQRTALRTRGSRSTTMPRMRSSTLARPRLPSIPTLASRMSPRYVSRPSVREAVERGANATLSVPAVARRAAQRRTHPNLWRELCSALACRSSHCERNSPMAGHPCTCCFHLCLSAARSIGGRRCGVKCGNITLSWGLD